MFRTINYVFDFVLIVFNVQNPELTTEYVMFGFNNTHITIPAGAIRNIKGSNSYIIVVWLTDRILVSNVFYRMIPEIFRLRPIWERLLSSFKKETQTARF